MRESRLLVYSDDSLEDVIGRVTAAMAALGVSVRDDTPQGPDCTFVELRLTLAEPPAGQGREGGGAS